MKRPNMLDSTAEPITEESKIEEEEEEEGRVNWTEKKRRLSAEQVKTLEKDFEVESKLEPERKTKLAMDLGLQPRQVAIWFQNRRARWKTKQLERDYVVLRNDYDALRIDHDALRLNHDALLVKIKELKSKSSMGSRKVEREEQQQNSNNYNNNNNNQDFVVKEQEESIALLHKYGSSDSDNSTILSDENSSNRFEDLFPPQHDQNQPLFLTGFNKDSRESCFYYFQEQQEQEQQELLMAMKEVPSLAWNCSDEWDWEDIC